MLTDNSSTIREGIKSIFNDSKYFQEPFLLKNYLNKPIFNEEIVRAILQKRAMEDIERAKNDCRVFVDGKLDFKLSQTLYENPPESTGSLEEYFKDIFKNSKDFFIHGHSRTNGTIIPHGNGVKHCAA